MNTFEHTPNEIPQISWDTIFHANIDECIAHEESTTDDLVDNIWKYGILEHISPSDPTAYKTREEREKTVFKRNDPELYAFLDEDLKKLQESIKSGRTIAGGFTTVIINAVAKTATSQINHQNIPHDFSVLTDTLIEKIAEKIKTAI